MAGAQRTPIGVKTLITVMAGVRKYLDDVINRVRSNQSRLESGSITVMAGAQRTPIGVETPITVMAGVRNKFI